MCGIFGAVSSRKEQSSSFEKSLVYLKRRGPDSEGAFKFSNKNWLVDFKHTRLAILDLTSDGNQPFESPDCPYVIIYNGEIFNYLEIKKELLDLKWRFSTKTDTEVLLKTWAQWGLGGLHRLNGMFSFAVLNKNTQEMWLIRDRFGEKPLHWGYCNQKKIFVFSSSISAIARCLDAPLDFKTCSLGLRFMIHECDYKASVFQGVKSVQPGGWIKIDLRNNSLSLKDGIWYNLDEAVNNKNDYFQNLKETELLDNCRNLLFDAVKLRLRSDVPLAVSLSGGLDSSSVSAIATKFNFKLQGFNYGCSSAKKSEGPVVERLSKNIGLIPRYIWPKLNYQNLDRILEQTLAAQEAPFSGFSVMAQNEVYKNASKIGYKVLLGGQGGDEIFAGYRKFFLIALRHAFHKNEIFEILRLSYSFGLMLFYEAPSANLYIQNLNRYKPKKKYSFSLLNWKTPTVDLVGPAANSLAKRQIQDIQKWSLPSLLRYEDRNSMAYGVETRLPLLDYRLVETAICLPTRLKINNGFGKWALREITKEIVPDFIRCNRKKRGFDVTQTWLQDGLGQAIRDRINGSKTILNPFLKRKIDFDQKLSNSALKMDSKLLDEALMLCWLINPLREPENRGI